MYRAGFIPSLDKEGWREAPGWFEAAIPQLKADSYMPPADNHWQSVRSRQRGSGRWFCTILSEPPSPTPGVTMRG